MADTKGPAWNMKGTLIIACNCEYGCPCNVNGRPTTGKCEGGWTWQLEQGVYGDVRLDGLCIGLYANWPAAIHEGNGVATTLIDQKANPAQREALQSLVEGRSAGPWAIFRKTFKELHGPDFVTYEVDTESRLPRVRAGAGRTEAGVDCARQEQRPAVDGRVVREARRHLDRRRADGHAQAGKGEIVREEGSADGRRIPGDRGARAAESVGLTGR